MFTCLCQMHHIQIRDPDVGSRVVPSLLLSVFFGVVVVSLVLALRRNHVVWMPYLHVSHSSSTLVVALSVLQSVPSCAVEWACRIRSQLAGAGMLEVG